MNAMTPLASAASQTCIPHRGEMSGRLTHNAARGSEFADELRTSAQQLVATAFVMPVLQQMDSSSLRPLDGPFAKNAVEKRFSPLMHQHLADRITGSQSFGLVDAVVKRFTRQAGET